MAICNESLGLAAYKYSSKKLSFLDNAKDAFTAAMLSLPTRPMLEHSRALSGADYQALLDIHPLLQPKRPLSSHQTPTLDPFACDKDIAVSKSKKNRDDIDSGYDTVSEPSPTEPKFQHVKRPSNADDLASLLPRFDSTDLAAFEKSTRVYTSITTLSDNLAHKECLVPRPLSIQKRASTQPAPVLSTSTALLPVRASSDPITNSQPPPSNPNITPTLVASHTQNLEDMRAQLTKHLSTLSTIVTATVNAQSAHRLTQSKRMASFWSFQPVQQQLDEDAENDGGSGRREAGKGRHRANTNGDGKGDAEKKERIDRLRRNGWKVTKEMHGWKGEAHYRDLREGALADLGVGR